MIDKNTIPKVSDWEMLFKNKRSGFAIVRNHMRSKGKDPLANKKYVNEFIDNVIKFNFAIGNNKDAINYFNSIEEGYES